jgi:hypothetical protein
MALTNAERQKRYRERLRAAAQGHDLAARITALFDAASRAASNIEARNDDGGYADWADVEPMPRPAATRRFQSGPPDPESLRRLFAAHLAEARPEERSVLLRAIEVLDAVTRYPRA